MNESLTFKDLTFSYLENNEKGSRPTLSNFNCEFAAGKINVLMGQNGCGKSTLLKLAAGILKPCSGMVTVDGVDIAKMSARARAQKISLLFQESVMPSEITVRELVLEGRYPHLGFFARPEKNDRDKAEAAILTCGLTALAERPLGTLSSGQRRLAWIAMTIAQETKWLLLDEPTTYLDVSHELDILKLIRRLNREFGISVIISIHDINAAAMIADRAYAMRNGILVAQGSPTAVMTPTVLREVFDAEATVVNDPTSSRPRIFWRCE